MKRRIIASGVLLLVLVLGGHGVNAFAYGSVVAYGDSLSDNGNLARRTDGLLWVESLADHLGACHGHIR